MPTLPCPVARDDAAVSAWLEQHADHKFVAACGIVGEDRYIHGLVSHAIAARTVRQILVNGHEPNLWVFVNPIEVRYDKRTRRRVYAELGENWVLDFDDTPFATIADLLAHFAALGLPPPAAVTQTSPNNFHALIKSAVPWNRKQRRALAAKVGADLNYATQSLSKMRVPGSVNTKHGFVCLGWTNPAPVQWAPPADEPTQRPLRVVPLATEATAATDESFGAVYVERIHALLVGLGIKQAADIRRLAELFAENITRLRRGHWRLGQTWLAKQIGISQPAASRLLARLAEAEIIVPTQGGLYVPNSRPKSYGLGTALAAVLAPSSEGPWQDKKASQQLLADVRAGVAAGKSDDEIVADLEQRQAHRPRHKLRSERELRATIERWRQRTGQYEAPALRLVGSTA